MIYTQGKRSFAKSVTFRIIVIAADLLVIYVITHRADVTIGLTIATNVASTILYFLHERIWNTIQWGRTEVSDRAEVTPPSL